MLSETNIVFDKIYFGLIEPVLIMAGRVLDAAILAPLDLLHAPQFLQVMVVAFLTGLLSLFLRRRVGLPRHERLFRQSFAARQKEQDQCMRAALDDKARGLIRQVGDSELDALYNDYLARRFVENGITYLLPLLTVCAWLEKHFSKDPGSTVLFFLAMYTLILILLMSKGQRKCRGSNAQAP